LSKCDAAVRIDVDDFVAEDGDSSFLNGIGAALRGKEHGCQEQNRQNRHYSRERGVELTGFFYHAIKKTYWTVALKNYPT